VKDVVLLAVSIYLVKQDAIRLSMSSAADVVAIKQRMDGIPAAV